MHGPTKMPVDQAKKQQGQGAYVVWFRFALPTNESQYTNYDNSSDHSIEITIVVILKQHVFTSKIQMCHYHSPGIRDKYELTITQPVDVYGNIIFGVAIGSKYNIENHKKRDGKGQRNDNDFF